MGTSYCHRSKVINGKPKIPECPHCQKPTFRCREVTTQSEALHVTVYDKEGNITDEAEGVEKVHWRCLACNTCWEVRSNA
jgi:hypothetical protein